MRTGSDAGNQVIEALPLTEVTTTQLDMAAAANEKARSAQQRSLPGGNLYPQQLAQGEHPHWDDIAARCLTCGNCTSVCPTCFCSNVLEETNLDGSETTRLRQWDSCFNFSHSHLAGAISVRSSGASRYRQWFTHKLASWQDQFGSLGCTGCGRCISWCPVGIDITEEVKKFRL